MSDRHLRAIVKRIERFGLKARYEQSSKHPRIIVDHPSGEIRLVTSSSPRDGDAVVNFATQALRRILVERGLGSAII